MSDQGQRPISVQLNDHMATIECGGCLAADSFDTADRTALVESVRLFLRDHEVCRPNADARLTAERRP
jgi:hypothetical protein